MFFDSELYLLITDMNLKLTIFKKKDSEYNFDQIKEFFIEKKLKTLDELTKNSENSDSSDNDSDDSYRNFENIVDLNEIIDKANKSCYEKQLFTLACSENYIFLNNKNDSPMMKISMKKLLKADQKNISELDFVQRSSINFSFNFKYSFGEEFLICFPNSFSVSKDGQYSIGIYMNDLILYNWKNNSSTKFFNELNALILSVYADFDRNLLITGHSSDKLVIRELFTGKIIYCKQIDESEDDEVNFTDFISVLDNILILGSSEGMIRQIDLNDYSINSDFPNIKGSIDGCELYHDNNQIYVFYTFSKIFFNFQQVNIHSGHN